MIRYLMCCFLMALSCKVYSQYPYFKEITIEQGNDDLKVNNVFQGAEGLIYIGTNQGFFRYDGFDFEKIDFPDSLRDKRVSCLTNSRKRELMVGLENGFIFIYRNEKLESLSSPLKSPVKCMLEMEDGTLWVASYGEGIFYRKAKDWHRLAGLPDPFIYQLLYHNSGRILAASDGGLIVIEPNTEPLRYRVYNSKDGLPDNIVKVMDVLPDNQVFLGFQEKGISVFNLNTSGFNNILPPFQWKYGSVNCITRLQNEFWLGTDANGLVDYEFSGDRRIRNFFNAEVFPYKKVNSLLRDKEGNVWIVADHKLILSPGERVEFVNASSGLGFDSIQAITASRDGYIWFSSAKGLFRFNYMASGHEKIRKYKIPDPLNPHIVSLYEDEAGYIWIGTFDNGLFRLHPESGKVRRFGVKDGLLNANVISIDGRDNVLWLATLGGIIQCTMRDPLQFGDEAGYTFEALSYRDKRYDGFVYSVYIDRKNRVWFGTDGNGILMYDGKKLNAFPECKDAKVIYSITEDANGNIWFSSQYLGMFMYDGKKFRNFNISRGLSSLDIIGVSNDNAGNVLVVNNKGVDIINPYNFEIKRMGEESGIKLLDADLNAVTRDPKGGVWIGSRKELIRIYNYNRDIIHQPRLILRSVITFMKQSVDLKDTVFDYNQNHISIEYTGLWYTQPDLLSYRYRLKGYSNDWIPTRDRVVTFPNLPPGRYTFEVMAGLAGQFNNSKVVRYGFMIRKPLWKENWLIFSAFLLLTSGILLYIRDRDIRLRKMESLKKEKVEYQFATLKSQVNPHFLFNSFNTLIGIIEEDKDKAVSYVEKLSDYFRNMVQHRDKDIVSLKEELEMVETYYFLQQKRYGQYLELVIEVPDAWKDHFGLPPLSLQLLIENAVKHNAVSFETPLYIKVAASGDSALVISNNRNPKITAEPSTGIGLENIMSRFHILTGLDVVVDESPAAFSVKIPLIKIVKDKGQKSLFPVRSLTREG